MTDDSLRRSLLVAQVWGVLTLVRSIAFDRWATVLTSILLVVGVRAALRDRAWGVVLAFAAALWFGATVLVGIAPPWFLLVAVLGALPFAKTWRAFARFDARATAILTAIAAAAGTFGAVLWKNVAWSLFAALPFLRPGIHPSHGLLVTLAAAIGTVAVVRSRERSPRVRVGSEVRVAELGEAGAASAVAVAAEEEEPAAEDRRAKMRL